MIRKTDRNLLKWIHDNIIDFEDENDFSGLTWNSTHEDAKKFLHSIPQKERVQKFGFYSTNSHFILVEDFEDIEVCLKNKSISQRSCSSIYRWNSEKGRENWNMEDVKEALGLGTMEYKITKHNYLYNTLRQLLDMELIECVNPEVKTGRMYKITEKGERILGLV